MNAVWVYTEPLVAVSLCVVGLEMRAECLPGALPSTSPALRDRCSGGGCSAQQCRIIARLSVYARETSRCPFETNMAGFTVTKTLMVCLLCCSAFALEAENTEQLRARLETNQRILQKLDAMVSSLHESIPVNMGGKSADPRVDQNPYAFMSNSGRGLEDAHTPFYGSYGARYGPVNDLTYGGVPNPATAAFTPPQMPGPPVFGAPTQFGLPQFGVPNMPGASVQGHTYQGPAVLDGVGTFYGGVAGLPTGLPFKNSPIGPYYTTPGAPAGSKNYTQFGPKPFGPYGTLMGAGSGSGPKNLPPSLSYIGQTLGLAANNGYYPQQMIPASFPGVATPGMMASYPLHTPMGGIHTAAMGTPSAYFPPRHFGQQPVQYGNGFIPVYRSAQPILPGLSPQYDPRIAFHHAMTLPGTLKQFKTPSMPHSLGLGVPSPDMDRYASVHTGVPAPPSPEAKKR